MIRIYLIPNSMHHHISCTAHCQNIIDKHSHTPHNYDCLTHSTHVHRPHSMFNSHNCYSFLCMMCTFTSCSGNNPFHRFCTECQSGKWCNLLSSSDMWNQRYLSSSQWYIWSMGLHHSPSMHSRSSSTLHPSMNSLIDMWGRWPFPQKPDNLSIVAHTKHSACPTNPNQSLRHTQHTHHHSHIAHSSWYMVHISHSSDKSQIDISSKSYYHHLCIQCNKKDISCIARW